MSEKKYPGEIVGYIYRTTDYGAFKKLKGNRDVFDPRKKRIKDSVKQIGWIRNPVVVNEKMEVIDGQGRTEALEELEMPIEYVVAEGATIDHCIALNIKQKNWGILDYIKSYAEQGNETMQQMLRHILKFGNLPVSAILEAITIGGRRTPEATISMIRGNSFEVYDEFACDELLQFITECMNLIGRGKGRIDTWAAALKIIYLCDELDTGVFLKKLKAQAGSVLGVTREIDAVKQCEKIYNYGTSDKVYFEPIIAQFRREGK